MRQFIAALSQLGLIYPISSSWTRHISLMRVGDRYASAAMATADFIIHNRKLKKPGGQHDMRHSRELCVYPFRCICLT